ncbi:MAG: hypothetical protein JXA71_16245 [Chitinispirillaceae bacterium]|nr:hypothetical protein [Chitinispirillaceae bacterium]
MARVIPGMVPMSLSIRASFLLFIVAAAVVAQSNRWPSYFDGPQKNDGAGDSAKLAISGNAKVFESYERTQTMLTWQPSLASARLRQQGVFETTHDRTFNATNQFYDFSGLLVKDSVLPYSGNLGIEWKPVSYINLRQSGSGFQTTGDCGPVAEWNILDVPLHLKGGVSGSSWSDSLPPSIMDSRMEDVQSDIGYYGACAVGDNAARFLDQPLYVNGEAFVRSISQAGLAVITGSALFAHDAGSGDSLYGYYGDSLSNGKENYWGTTGGRQQYINTPWRIARSFLAAGGMKAKERAGFQPGIHFSLSENSVRYPNIQSVLSDVRQRIRSLNFQLRTKEALPVLYSGGITFSWGNEEWLFGNDLSLLASARTRTSRQVDSLRVKLNDHDKYKAVMDNHLGITLPKGILLKYTLSAFRDSRTYTFSYIEDTERVRNSDDNDRITFNHHAGIAVTSFHGLDAELYGEYSLYTLNYIQKERSGDNYSEDGYRVGLNCVYRPSERFSIDERITADAEITDYLYKQAHREPFDPPPYLRRLTSILTSVWQVSDGWELRGRWLENAYDKGRWYGREYRNNDSLREKNDYYAVETKTIDYTVELSCAMVRKAYRVEGGGLVRDIFEQRFNGADYEVNDLGIGYIIEPFVTFHLAVGRFLLRGRITRMINTEASDRWEARKNWDIQIVGSATW